MSGMNTPLEITVSNAGSWLLQAQLNLATVNLNQSTSPGPYTARVVLKASQTATDASGTTYESGSAELAIEPGTQGYVTFTIADTVFTTAGTTWWRFDVIDVLGNPYCVMFGPVYCLAA